MKWMRNNFYGFGSLFNLINHSFWRGIFGPFFAFGFPLIFVTILGLLLGYDQILAGALSIGPIAIAVTSMPQSIFEFKKSTLLKRIGSTPIKPWFFMLTIGFYYVLVMFISLIWSFLFSLIIFGIPYWDVGREISEAIVGTNARPAILAPSFSKVLNVVNWGGFIWAQLMTIMVGVACGLTIASFARSSIMIQALGTMILISTQFITAQVLPPSMVSNIEPMWYLGYVLSPFKSPISIALESWNGDAVIITTDIGPDVVATGVDFIQSNPFDLNAPWEYFEDDPLKKITILTSSEKYLNVFLPFIWFATLIATSIKKFKWSVRS